MEPIDRDELRSGCSRALSGAERVQGRLLSLLSIGPDNILETYYAIKSRIKSEKSLAKKVVRKVEIDGIDYSPEQATDIVGLRILTVSSSDLLKASLDFIDLVSFGQRDDVQLFAGRSLEDAISEIIVYSSGINKEAYESVHNSLKKIFPNDPDKVEPLKIPSDDKPYSSIHIVCNCIAGTERLEGGTQRPKLISVEVQIRTIFEDAWNEVDHPIRYKGTRDFRKSDLRAEHRTTARNIDDDLKILKGALENCGRTADKIRGEYDKLKHCLDGDNNKSTIQTLSFSIEENYEISDRSKLSEKHWLRLLQYHGESEKFFELTTGFSSSHFDKYLYESQLLINDIEDLIEDYKKKVPDQFQIDIDFRYFSMMALALLYTWRARLIRDTRMGRKGHAFDQELLEALKIYLEMEENTDFEKDAFLRYRLSNCLRLYGFSTETFDSMKSAIHLREACPRLKKTSIINVLILRHYAFLIWEKKNKLSSFGEGIAASSTYKLKERCKLLHKAISFTNEAIDFYLKNVKDNGDSHSFEYAKCLGNLVSYYWEIKKECSDAFFIKIQEETNADFIKLGNDLTNLFPSDQLNLARTDSIMVAYSMGEDTKKASKWWKIQKKKRADDNQEIDIHTPNFDFLRNIDYNLSIVESQITTVDKKRRHQ